MRERESERVREPESQRARERERERERTWSVLLVQVRITGGGAVLGRGGGDGHLLAREAVHGELDLSIRPLAERLAHRVEVP